MFQVVVKVFEIVVCFVTSNVQLNVAFAHWILLPLMFPDAEIVHALVIEPSVALPALSVPSNSAFHVAFTSHEVVMSHVAVTVPSVIMLHST